MGALACAVADLDPELTLTAAYAPGHQGSHMQNVTMSGDPHTLNETDVIVEFAPPDVVMTNVQMWNDLGGHLVIGTSGFDGAKLHELRSTWTSQARCLVVPNFSIGAILMMQFAEQAAAHFPVAEIVEIHHDGKVDAPSGTAINTAERIGSVRSSQDRSKDAVASVEGALGGEVAGVRIHSMRLPGVVANQEVVFGATGQTLTIRHDTTDRSAFGPGIALGIKGVGQLTEPVTIGLDSLLG